MRIYYGHCGQPLQTLQTQGTMDTTVDSRAVL